MTLSRRHLRWAGTIGVAAGVIGALAAAVMIAWPAQVPKGPLMYPFTREGFLAAQAFFFVHHLAMVAVVAGFAASGAAGTSRVLRGGAWLAVLGTLLLSLAELNTMRFAELDTEQANAGLVGASYGISCNLVGLGMILAGAGTLRARRWTGWRRWTPLAIGIATFVELTPGMFGGYVIARLAIGFWILLFGALGQALRTESAGEPGPA